LDERKGEKKKILSKDIHTWGAGPLRQERPVSFPASVHREKARLSNQVTERKREKRALKSIRCCGQMLTRRKGPGATCYPKGGKVPKELLSHWGGGRISKVPASPARKKKVSSAL